MFWAEIWKNQKYLSENFTIFGGKISVYLNMHVFVMKNTEGIIPKAHARFQTKAETIVKFQNDRL